MAHTLTRLDPSKQDFSLGWSTGTVVGNRMEWWPQTATFEGDDLAHLPVAQPDGFEDDTEYLDNVQGSCGHHRDDAHACVHCGEIDCCEVYEACADYQGGDWTCRDCTSPCRCPECVGV